MDFSLFPSTCTNFATVFLRSGTLPIYLSTWHIILSQHPVHVSTCLGSCGLGLHQGVNTHSHQHSVIPNSNYLTAAQIIENGGKKTKKQLLLPNCLCSFWQHPLTCCSCVPSLTSEKVLWASKVAKTRSPPGTSQTACVTLELLSYIWSHDHIPGLSRPYWDIVEAALIQSPLNV